MCCQLHTRIAASPDLSHTRSIRTGSHRCISYSMSFRRSARLASRQEGPLDGQENSQLLPVAAKPKKSRHSKAICSEWDLLNQQQEQQEQDEKENAIPATKTVAACLPDDYKQTLRESGIAANNNTIAAEPRSTSSKNTKGRKAGSAAASGPTRAAEQALWAKGFKAVAGVDEAGRGPLAGPVVAAAAVLPADIEFVGLNDSKQMTEEGREELFEQLTSHPDVIWAVAVVDHEMIDEINILQAAMLAMEKAVHGLSSKPDHVLIDGNRRPKGLEHLPMQTLVKGDATSTCIAAASVIAKVTRDRMMLELDAQYPQYGFAQHKGYGVPAHRAAIQKHGPCPVHRRSFEPVKSITGWKGYGQKAALAAAAAAEVAATTEAVTAATEEGNITAAPACQKADAPPAAAAQHDQMQEHNSEQQQQQRQPAKQHKRRITPGDAKVTGAVQAGSADPAHLPQAGARRRRRKA